MSKTIDELETRVTELESRIESIEEEIKEPETRVRTRKRSINEFKQDHEASSHTEKATLIAYYIEIHDSTEEWTLRDIKNGYKKCKWPLPTNLSDVLRRTEGKGHIMQIGKQERAKLWQLTETGIQFVENDLQK